MSLPSTVATPEQINLTTLLPTYHPPQRARPLPAFDPHLPDYRTMLARSHATAFHVRTWFNRIEGYTSLIGLVIAIITLIVTVIGIIVAAVITFAVK